MFLKIGLLKDFFSALYKKILLAVNKLVTMKVHLIRHGQSIANESKSIIQGQLNSLLSSRGKKQSKDLTHKLNFNFDAVFSSPLERAKQTAIISLGPLDFDTSKIVYEEGLKEISMGEFEGLTFEEVGIKREEFKPLVRMLHDVYLDKYKGESISIFKNRVIKAFDRIVHQCENDDKKSILIYSHGGVMRVIMNHHLGLYDGPVHNTELISIQKIDGKWNLFDKKEILK